ncbi:MAG: RNA polymerase sigma factor [Acidobacteriota bacterium]
MLLDAAGALQIAGEDPRTERVESAASSVARNLVLRAQAGATDAFEQLMACFQRQVLCTATRILHRSEDAKDAAQEVFFKLYRYLPRIKPEAVRTWLYRVTVTVCSDMVKKSSRVPTSNLEDEPAGDGPSVADEQKIEAGINLEEQRAILQDALQALPFKERTALVLRDIEGLSTEEAAQILGSSATTIRSQISSARVKVRRYCERAMERTR